MSVGASRGGGIAFDSITLGLEATMPASLTAAAETVRLVDDYFRAPIDALRAEVTPFAVELDWLLARGDVSVARLDALVEPYSERLRALESVDVFGAGFIAARGIFGDAAGHLSWWQGHPCRKLLLAAESKAHIDYSALEWFRIPAETGAPHIAGPYVDYLCNDEYTLTHAVPVPAERGFAGVMALDVLVATAERDLLPRLAALGEEVTVVNRTGRVLLSTGEEWVTGDTVREPRVDGFGTAGFGVLRG